MSHDKSDSADSYGFSISRSEGNTVIKLISPFQIKQHPKPKPKDSLTPCLACFVFVFIFSEAHVPNDSQTHSCDASDFGETPDIPVKWTMALATGRTGGAQ